jgi:hypothetical protein
VHTKFFLFDSERASGMVFNRRPPVKMVDFHDDGGHFEAQCLITMGVYLADPKRNA